MIVPGKSLYAVEYGEWKEDGLGKQNLFNFVVPYNKKLEDSSLQEQFDFKSEVEEVAFSNFDVISLMKPSSSERIVAYRYNVYPVTDNYFREWLERQTLPIKKKAESMFKEMYK